MPCVNAPTALFCSSLSLSRSFYSSPGIILCLLLGKKRRRRKRLKKVGGRDGDDTSTKKYRTPRRAGKVAESGVEIQNGALNTVLSR